MRKRYLCENLEPVDRGKMLRAELESEAPTLQYKLQEDDSSYL
jgi:hypothetical protein